MENLNQNGDVLVSTLLMRSFLLCAFSKYTLKYHYKYGTVYRI